MLLWFAILIGALGAYLAGRKSFYANWVIFFNILISIYTGVMLAPVLLDLLSDNTSSYKTCRHVLNYTLYLPAPFNSSAS
jgi:disulfide bond formation protein DsbB